jgi:tripartite-type tricarboxylate transporter receptor subunit TctC
VSLLAKIANVLAVRKDLPARTVQELVAYGKANPGKLTYASQGGGSTAHLSGAQLEIRAGIKMVHVPYRGAAPALNDLIAGHIDMFFDTLTTSVPLHQADKIRIMAVAGDERAPTLPDIPTIAESGLPGFRSITWFAMVGPPAMPASLAARINRDVVDVLQRPAVSAKLRDLRLDPMIGTPADAARFFAEETELWGKVIREAGVTVQ